MYDAGPKRAAASLQAFFARGPQEHRIRIYSESFRSRVPISFAGVPLLSGVSRAAGGKLLPLFPRTMPPVVDASTPSRLGNPLAACPTGRGLSEGGSVMMVLDSRESVAGSGVVLSESQFQFQECSFSEDLDTCRSEQLPSSEPSTQHYGRDAAADGPTSPGAVVRNMWARTTTKWRRLREAVRKHPITALVPIIVFALAVTVGLLGIWAGCQGVRSQRRFLTAEAVRTAARETSMTLQLWAAPAIATVSVICEQPRVPILVNNLDNWMAPLVDTNKELYGDTGFSLSLYPWGINTAIYPPTETNLAALNLNLLTHPFFSSSSIELAASPAGSFRLLGPIQQPEGIHGKLFMFYFNIWLSPSDYSAWRKNWGMEQNFTFPWAKNVRLGNQTQPPWMGPCGSSCAPRLQPDGTYLEFWGFVILTIPGNSIIDRLDSLADKDQHETAFNYLLYRKDFPSVSELRYLEKLDKLPSGQVILAETPGASARATDVENSCTDLNTTVQLSWALCVTPVDGYDPSWRITANIAVVFASFILALLMLMLMESHANHKALVGAMLPPKAIKYLNLNQTYAEPFQMVTILFSDIVSYTELSSQLSPMEVVQMLDQLYSGFDDLVDKHKLYKVETIGDAFMCVGGAPDPCNPHDAARRVAQMALDMIKLADTFETSTGRKIQIRVGMHSGNVTAAVMGRKMPHWCLVGDAVNVSSRMESNSRPMQVHVGATTAHLLGMYPQFSLKPRGLIDIKGKGRMSTYWLTAPAAAADTAAPGPAGPGARQFPVLQGDDASSPVDVVCQLT